MSLSLSLLLDLFTLLLDAFLHLLDTLLVVDFDDFLNSDYFWCPGEAELGGVSTLLHHRQLFSQLQYLVLELTDHGVLGILVDSGLVLDVLGATRPSQGVNGLLHVVVSGTDVGDHNCFGVSAQGVL